jgi:hypothetical protein
MILDKKNKMILPGHLLLVKHTQNNEPLPEFYRGLVRSIDKDSVDLNIDSKFINVPLTGRDLGEAVILDKRKSWAVVEG